MSTTAAGASPSVDGAPAEKQVRSRNGCVTCRKRKKKCDETKDPKHNGACERCFVASYECEWPKPPGERPLRTFQKGVRSANKGAKAKAKGATVGAGSAEGSSRGVSLEASTSAPQHSMPPPTSTASSFSFPPSVSNAPFHPPPPPPPPHPTVSTSYPPPAMISPTFPLAAHPSQQQQLSPSAYPAYAPSTTPAHSPHILAPHSHPHPSQPHQLHPQRQSFSSPYPPPSQHPPQPVQPPTPAPSAQFSPYALAGALPALAAPTSLHLGFSTDPHAPYNSILDPSAELNSFFSSLDAEFGAWEANTGSSSNGASSAAWAQSPGSGRGGLAELMSHDPHNPAIGGYQPGETTTADGVQLDTTRYQALNEGWFASIPKPIRDIVCEKVFKVANSSSSGRHAAMAMVMLYRLRQQQAQGVSSDPADVASFAGQQQRLLEAGNSHFQSALDHLSGKDIPFSAKLLSALDLYTFQFDVNGAGACHAILQLNELFIIEELGHQPMVNFTTIQDATSILLVPFVWTDVLRSVCILKRRSLFSFASLPGDDPSVPWVCPPSALQAHLGLPFGIMLCLAAIGNLAAEQDSLPDAIVKVKAEAIEKAIYEWCHPTPDTHELADAAGYTESVGTAEMWRHASIIFLYQVIHNHGPASTVLSTAVRQILSVGIRLLHSYSPIKTSLLGEDASTAPLPTAATSTASNAAAPTAAAAKKWAENYLGSSVWRDGPWFLAGTCALLPQDRELCREGVRQCGPLAGYRDNALALERIWRESDETGWLVDWRRFLAERNPPMYVGFL